MEDVQQRNKATSQREVLEFQAHPPSKYIAYWNGDGRITTWIGDTLGYITWQGRAYHCPGFYGFSSTRINFRMQGSNGKYYVGTYYQSAGDYVRFRAVREEGH